MSKGLEALQFMRERDMFIHSCANTIEKELKALEIIKEMKCFTFYEIEGHYYISGIGVSKEKYDLLKEVLLWAFAIGFLKGQKSLIKAKVETKRNNGGKGAIENESRN